MDSLPVNHSVDRYVVCIFGDRFNIRDSYSGNACFVHGFEDKHVASAVARELNKASFVKPQFSKVSDLPFTRWITLIKSGHTEQVVSEMKSSQKAMFEILSLIV